MRMIKLLAIFTIFCALTSCATTRKFDQWQTHKIYEWAYEDALDVVASAISSKTLEKCHFMFEAPIPPTTPVASVEVMEMLYGKKVQGLYREKWLEVIFVKQGDYSGTLKHEYAHYLYDVSNLSEYCKKQAFAYLVQYGAAQRLAMERWRRMYEKERNKNLGRSR